jgi:hypothetical protein
LNHIMVKSYILNACLNLNKVFHCILIFWYSDLYRYSHHTTLENHFIKQNKSESKQKCFNFWVPFNHDFPLFKKVLNKSKLFLMKNLLWDIFLFLYQVLLTKSKMTVWHEILNHIYKDIISDIMYCTTGVLI